MGKILTSPLFIALAFFFIYLLFAYFRWQDKSKTERLFTVALTVVTVTLFLLSTPAVSTRLAWYLEAPHSRIASGLDVDLVTVLSGGIFHGPSPGLDTMGYSSTTRVVRGVRTFKESEAEFLAMQGLPYGSKSEQMTGMMKTLAVEMGVPEDNILTEPHSRNTREHPGALLDLEEVQSTDRIAVVTSAWHLERAVREFERYFAEVKAVPAEFYSYIPVRGLRNWLPQVSALEISTRIIHEVIGMTWYRLQKTGD